MATFVYNVPAGSTSNVIAVTPLQSILVGPAVLGGTASLSFATNPNGPFLAWSFGASTSPQSFRAATTGYIQVTAATQAANVAVSDMNQLVNNLPTNSLMSINESFASGSSTSEQIVGSLRVPPGILLLNGRLRISGGLSMVNNANAKTLQVRVNGIGGTIMFQSPALASNANYNFQTEIGLRNDGITQLGCGAGSAGGLGLSTTAYASFSTVNYLQNEIEYVVTVTKATAGDLAQLETLTVQLL